MTTAAITILEAIRNHGERTAYLDSHGRATSYREIDARVARVVTVFRDLGCTPGDRLAIWLENRIEWPILSVAAALLGLTIVPINVRYRSEELVHALDGATVRWLITSERFLTNRFLDLLRDLGGGRIGHGQHAAISRCPALERILLLDHLDEEGGVDLERLLACAAPADDLPALALRRQPEEPSWLFWTSGTTSAPKGALLPQSTIGMISSFTSLLGYEARDRVLAARPFFYIAGHFWCMIAPLLHGAAIIEAQLFTPAEIQLRAAEGAVTIISSNPLFLKSLIEAPTFDPAAFAHLRAGYFGGSSLGLEEMRRIREKLGYRTFVQTYGMTELGGFVLSTLPSDTLEESCVTCGVPIGETELSIVDPETGREVEEGATGELVTRNQKLIDYVGLGMDDRRKVFDAEGRFRTGDLMRRIGDRYQLVGRCKDLIKVGGENVSSAEIEALLVTHPSVSLAAVVGTADPERGEIPLAFIEWRADALSAEEMRAWCRTRIAPFKVPARFINVAHGGWPMTASGKIAKHQLTEPL